MSQRQMSVRKWQLIGWYSYAPISCHIALVQNTIGFPLLYFAISVLIHFVIYSQVGTHPFLLFFASCWQESRLSLIHITVRRLIFSMVCNALHQSIRMAFDMLNPAIQPQQQLEVHPCLFKIFRDNFVFNGFQCQGNISPMLGNCSVKFWHY